eukprot:COSAG04_NODE_368_length_15757_cov_6.049176_11_plen_154_part_00
MLVYAFSCDKAAAVAQSAGSTRITMKQPCFFNLVMGKPLSMGNRTPAFVDNVREHLNTPGQWYFDKARQEILCYPLPGQDLNKVEVIVAVEETLVKHVTLQNHAWRGITFEHGTWLRPMQNAGFVEEQTGACDVCAPTAWSCRKSAASMIPSS